MNTPEESSRGLCLHSLGKPPGSTQVLPRVGRVLPRCTVKVGPWECVQHHTQSWIWEKLNKMKSSMNE